MGYRHARVAVCTSAGLAIAQVAEGEGIPTKHLASNQHDHYERSMVLSLVGRPAEELFKLPTN